jgi:hypothetical protein
MPTGRFDLKTPCMHCPFSTHAEGIRFHDQFRALEIYLTADNWGFPCHKSATSGHVDGDEDYDEGSGFVFKKDGSTQHCVGALIMFMKEGRPWTRGTGMDRQVFEDLRKRVAPDAPVFNSIEEFLAANRGYK